MILVIRIHWASRVRRVGARDAGPRNREGAVAFAPCERDDAASS